MKKNMMRQGFRFLIAFIFLVAIISILVPVFQKLSPVLIDLYKKGDRAAAMRYLRSFGHKGIIIIIFLQVAQVLSLVIPAPPVWVVAGMSYGIFFGMLICMVGVIIGNSIAFLIGRKYGNQVINILFDENKLKRFKFLESSKHSALIQFFLYVIPGMPNNIIPYIYARTRISYKKFISIIAIASIPAILSCTYVGQNLISGNIVLIIVIVAIFLIFSLSLVLSNKKILILLERFSDFKNK